MARISGTHAIYIKYGTCGQDFNNILRGEVNREGTYLLSFSLLILPKNLI